MTCPRCKAEMRAGRSWVHGSNYQSWSCVSCTTVPAYFRKYDPWDAKLAAIDAECKAIEDVNAEAGRINARFASLVEPYHRGYSQYVPEIP